EAVRALKTELLPGTHGELIGAALHLVAAGTTSGARVAVGIEPAAGLEAANGRVPGCVAPAASPSCLVLAGARDERRRGLAGVEPGANDTDDVTITAVLAKQIEGVPEEEMRRVRARGRGGRATNNPAPPGARPPPPSADARG